MRGSLLHKRRYRSGAPLISLSGPSRKLNYPHAPNANMAARGEASMQQRAPFLQLKYERLNGESASA